MKQNGIGGANTKTGLIFEGKTDLKTFLKIILLMKMTKCFTKMNQ